MGASRAEIEALYRDHYLGFRRGLAALTGSFEAAHDAVQEAFARALAQRRQFRGDGPLGAWVWQIALRVALDERHRSARVSVEEVLEERLVEPAPDSDLLDALRVLPPRRRAVFFLRYYADMSYEEIAAVCGISEGTVGAAISKGRAAIVAALAVPDALREEARR